VALAFARVRRVLAVSRGETLAALSRFGGVFEDVVAHPTEINADPDATLYVSNARWRRAEVRSVGMHAVAPRALAQALAAYSSPTTVPVP
jgi:hypothetical protein